jgi:hypothetical protein
VISALTYLSLLARTDCRSTNAPASVDNLARRIFSSDGEKKLYGKSRFRIQFEIGSDHKKYYNL